VTALGKERMPRACGSRESAAEFAETLSGSTGRASIECSRDQIAFF